MPDPATITFRRVTGDHLIERIRFAQPDGSPVDLTGITAAEFRIATAYGQAAAWAATIVDGITVTAASGILDISKALGSLAVGDYVYDLSTTVGGVTETRLRGRFVVLGEVGEVSP